MAFRGQQCSVYMLVVQWPTMLYVHALELLYTAPVLCLDLALGNWSLFVSQPDSPTHRRSWGIA